MKIGIVCYPTFGGSGVVATELGMALAEKGHEVHFITYNQPVKLDAYTPNIFYHEVSVADYPLFDYPPYELVLASKLVDVVKYASLDLLHVHYAIPHASAAYMAKKILETEGINIPFITTLHGTDITLLGKDPSFEPVISFAINQSDAVTAVSESLRDDTLNFFNVNKEISVIPNFIRLEDYDLCKKCNRSLYAKDDEKLLIHVSNFRKVKRVEDVIGVFKRVSEKIPSKLILIGDGPERANLERICRGDSTCDEIIWLGKLRDPERVLCVADLFLLTSETESFGLAALEAMAAKVPVISTNTGGIPEVNVDGETGLLSDVGDVHGMATNAIKLLSDDKLLEEYKENAYARAALFDINTVLPKYEALYSKVVSSAKKNSTP